MPIRRRRQPHVYLVLTGPEVEVVKVQDVQNSLQCRRICFHQVVACLAFSGMRIRALFLDTVIVTTEEEKADMVALAEAVVTLTAFHKLVLW
ncbi:hypothetical protein ACE6H2_010516 [Prunus campanulata]